ncbi:MAG: septum site-determining protein MinC [Lachnospiraceae bacterium]
MKNLVVIKCNKYGLLVYLDENAPYQEIMTQIECKFKESSKFFKDAVMAVSFEGRVLTNGQEREIVDLISSIAQVHIVCIMDRNKNTEVAYKSVVDECMENKEQRDGQFYKGTLRRRQVLESETSVIVLGDVDLGATIVAKGNIVVLGTIRGSVHAGASGDMKAFVVALGMQPKQLRIAEVEAHRLVLGQKDTAPNSPKIAVLDGECIYVDPLIY